MRIAFSSLPSGPLLPATRMPFPNRFPSVPPSPFAHSSCSVCLSSRRKAGGLCLPRLAGWLRLRGCGQSGILPKNPCLLVVLPIRLSRCLSCFAHLPCEGARVVPLSDATRALFAWLCADPGARLLTGRVPVLEQKLVPLVAGEFQLVAVVLFVHLRVGHHARPLSWLARVGAVASDGSVFVFGSASPSHIDKSTMSLLGCQALRVADTKSPQLVFPRVLVACFSRPSASLRVQLAVSRPAIVRLAGLWAIVASSPCRGI